MKTKWGEIYCYLVLFITTCALLSTSCFLISAAYDLYSPSDFDHQFLKTTFYEKLKDPNFEWEAPANSKLKKYAVKHYERKNNLAKDFIFLVFFMFASAIHVLILRRMRKTS